MSLSLSALEFDVVRVAADLPCAVTDVAAAERAQRALAGRRHVTANSACGVCGRRSIEDLLDGVRTVRATTAVTREVVESMPCTLRDAQRTFDRTGGLHAAGLFTHTGRLLRIAEDVGRHNAVDKVIGASLLAGETPLEDTGRALRSSASSADRASTSTRVRNESFCDY